MSFDCFLRDRWFAAVLLGPDLRIDLINARFARALCGRNITGKTLHEAFPELDEQVLGAVERTLRARNAFIGIELPITLDWTFTGKLETRKLTLACLPIEGSLGDGVVAFGVDVTAIVTGPVTTTGQRTPMQEVLDSLPIPTMLVEPRTRRLIYSNEAARALDEGALSAGTTFGHAMGLDTGYFCTDMSGKRIADEEMPSSRASRGELVEAFELLWHTPTTTLSILCFAELLSKANDFDSYIVMSLFDVTHLRRVERDLRAARRGREDFVTLVAHELRTPLTALQLQVQALRRRTPDAIGLAAVERATMRMAAIVEEVVDIGEIAEHGVQLHVEDVDLVDLVSMRVREVRENAARAGCTITIEGCTSARGRWDRVRLAQVVNRLLSNAIKFGRGHPIRFECIDTGECVRLSIIDRGPGIATDDQALIFERFERAGSSIGEGGLGAGLWLCREIVNRMGGELSVVSSQGRGATFVVVLPKVPRPS